MFFSGATAYHYFCERNTYYEAVSTSNGSYGYEVKEIEADAFRRERSVFTHLCAFSEGDIYSGDFIQRIKGTPETTYEYSKQTETSTLNKVTHTTTTLLCKEKGTNNQVEIATKDGLTCNIQVAGQGETKTPYLLSITLKRRSL